MIVTQANGLLHLITQPGHAALAARVMRHWAPLQGASRRAAILHAIEEHDNGWRDVDDAPTVNPETGRLHDFIGAPAAVRQGVWPRGVNRLAQDPWAAALVAHHAVTVYDRYRGDDEWREFFAGMERMRDGLIAQTPLSFDDLAQDYAFVRIGDLISLIFCARWEGDTYGPWRFSRDGDRVTVHPDPFDGRTIPIAIAARQLPDAPFASDTGLQAALRSAPIVTLNGIVSGS